MLKDFTRIVVGCLMLVVTLTVNAAIPLPFTMTESIFNSSDVEKEGEVTYQEDYFRLGGGSSGIFSSPAWNWDDKSVVIRLSDAPDRAVFSSSCTSSDPTGSDFYMAESADGTTWNKIWENKFSLTGGGWNNSTGNVELNKNTRYVKFLYSYNFAGRIHNLSVSKCYYIYFYSEGKLLQKSGPYRYGENLSTITTPDPTKECYNFLGWSLPSTMPQEDLTLTAQFEKIRYTSTFKVSDENSGVALPDYDQSFYCGDAMSVDDPVSTGYTFDGWSPALPSTVSSEIDGKTFVANWTRNLYKYIVFTTDVDSIIQNLYYAVSLEPLANPVRRGYTFLKWDKEQPATMPAEDLIIKALWQQNDYRLVLYSSDEDSTVSTFHFGDAIPQITEPEKTGYEFGGWSETLPALMPDSDIVVKALWNRASYRLVVYKTETDSSVVMKEYGESLSDLQIPERTGYSFVKWDVEVPGTMPAQDVVVRAVWEKTLYNIILLVDGKEYYKRSYEYQDTVDMSSVPNPAKVGFVFLNWGVDFPTTMPARSLTYEAQWMKESHRIVYVLDAEDATKNDTVYYEYGDVIKSKIEPERKGYAFMGWDKDLPSTMPANDITITAKWSRNVYRYVVYTTETDSTEIKFYYGNELPDLKDPVRKGYTFNGWDVDKPGTMPAADLIIHALWSQNIYRLVAYTSESDSIEMLYHYGEDVDSLEDPYKTGFDFQGWDTPLPTTMPDSDIALHAVWKVAKFNLVLVKNADSNDTVSVEYGASIDLENPSLEGYTFDGWSPALPSTMPAEDFTATAKWIKNKYRYVIYFNDADSIVEDVFYGESLPALDNQTLEGYEFNGWSIDQPATMPAHDLSIRALWSKKSYTINLLVDDEVYFTQKIEFGAEIVLENYQDPTKAGYKFMEWDGTPFPATMPAHDLSYVAVWTANRYSLVVVNDDENPMLNDTFYYYCDAKIKSIQEPEKLGFEFAGWNQTAPENMPSHNVILVAKWIARNYRLAFYVDDELYYETTCSYGAEINYKNVPRPSKTGNFFIGWSNSPSTMPANDVKLNASWSTNAYRLVVVNDEDNLAENDTLYYEYGATVEALKEPTKMGYTFLQWDAKVPTTMPAEDMEIRALWTINTYSLTTLVNCKPTVANYTYGDEVTMFTPYEVGYEFKGWSVEVPSAMPAHNVLLIADMQLLRYDLVLKTDEKEDTLQYYYNDVIDTPSNPEKEGFTFLGWNPEIPQIMPAENVKTTAEWQRNTYRLSLVSDDDTITIPYLFDASVETPAVPEKSGFTFLGWSDDVPEKMPAKDLTLEAEWKANNYNLVVIVDDDTTSVKYAYGRTIAMPETPSLTGYSFVKWNKEIPETMPAYDDTLVAYLVPNKYTLTWKMSETDTVSSTYSYRDSVRVLENPSRRGYTFLGWSDEVPSVMPARNVELEAEWEINSYELTIRIDDKETVSKYAYGQEIERTPNPKKEGFTFLGWNPEMPLYMPDSSLAVEAEWRVNMYELTVIVDEDTTRDQYDYLATIDSVKEPEKEGYTFDSWTPNLPMIMPAENVTVTAMWSKNFYDFTKIVEKDTTTTVYGYNEPIATVNTPEKIGFSFEKWSNEVPEVMPAENVTIEAVWRRNSYDLSFDVDSQTTVVTYFYGDTISSLPSPSKTGYLFVGWSEDLPEIMPAHDVSVSALWEKSQYRLSLVSGVDTIRYLYAYGDTIVVDDLTRTGYTFEKWSPSLPVTMPASDVYAEAIWNINHYTLRTIVDTNITETEYLYQQKVIVPKNPIKEGYTFVSWSDTIPTNMPANNVELMANFKVDSFNLRIIVDDSVENFIYEYDAMISKPENPTKKGSQFVGWSDTIPTVMPATDLTFTAMWMDEVYRLTIIVESDTIDYEYGYLEDVSRIFAPSVDGKKFIGWSDTIPQKMPDKDLIIKAIFKQNTYNLITIVDDATVVESYEFGDTISAPDVPSKIGHSFAGWSVDFPVTMPDSNVTAVALWSVNEYNFTIIHPNDTIVVTYQYGSRIDSVSVPEIKGSHFDGWSDSIPAVMPAHGVTVSSVFTPDTFMLTIKVADGELVEKHMYGDALSIPDSVNMKGYKFVGWNENLPPTMPDSDLSVSAILLPELHILTFVADDDTFVQEYAFGTPIEEVAVGDKLGYTFEGWDVELPTTMPAQDLVVNAVWSINVHTFSYTTDGRTVSVKYSYGDSIKVPGNPEKYGHHFVGWSDTVPQTMPDCDVKINSVWEPNTYCVTIISDEEIYDKVYIQYGDSIVLPKVKKFGYRFSGWNKKFPATMPAKDFTLTAQFKPKGELFVYSKDHVLYIDGVEKDAQVIVVDVLGRVAYHGKSHEIDLENDGDYIVMCRGQVVKTFVK